MRQRTATNLLSPSLPPACIILSCCADHESIVTDLRHGRRQRLRPAAPALQAAPRRKPRLATDAHRTKLMWTPRPRCTPLHSRHMKMPYDTDAHCGLRVLQSTHTWAERVRAREPPRVLPRRRPRARRAPCSRCATGARAAPWPPGLTPCLLVTKAGAGKPPHPAAGVRGARNRALLLLLLGRVPACVARPRTARRVSHAPAARLAGGARLPEE